MWFEQIENKEDDMAPLAGCLSHGLTGADSKSELVLTNIWWPWMNGGL